jgi:hypothetical protein
MLFVAAHESISNCNRFATPPGPDLSHFEVSKGVSRPHDRLKVEPDWTRTARFLSRSLPAKVNTQAPKGGGPPCMRAESSDRGSGCTWVCKKNVLEQKNGNPPPPRARARHIKKNRDRGKCFAAGRLVAFSPITVFFLYVKYLSRTERWKA